MTTTQIRMSWLAQIVSAAILLMAAVPKLTSAADSVAMFTGLGADPWGRYAVGGLELIAAVLLLLPKPLLGRHAYGALIAAGLMVGALGTHALKLGFTGAMTPLAIMATIVLVASIVILRLRSDDLLGPKRVVRTH